MPAYGVFIDYPDLEQFAAALNDRLWSESGQHIYTGHRVDEGAELGKVAIEGGQTVNRVKIITLCATALHKHNDIPVVLRYNHKVFKVAASKEALERGLKQISDEKQKLKELLAEMTGCVIENGRLDFE